MFSFLIFYIIFIFAAFLIPHTHGSTTHDTISDVATTKGGILIKNGKQTSCELGVIDSTAAFVAAPCLDLIGNSFNTTTVYEVYLDAGINNTPAKYSVNSIALHPLYNATTNLNPIGIIQFNNGSTETWSNPIAINRDDSWGDILFISRGLTDMDSLQWRTPLTTINGYSSVANCNADTHLFQSNQNDLICSNATTYSPFTYLTGCAIPYGSVDAYIDDKLYIAGMYSFTSITADGYQCTLRKFQDSMYVLFADYIAFASSILNRSIGYYPDSNGIAPQSNSGYSMTTPKDLITFWWVENGDFYANQTDSLQDDSSSSNSNNMGQSQASSSSSKNHNSSTANVHVSGVTATDTETEPPFTISDEISDSISGGHALTSKKVAIIGVVCGVLGGTILTGVAWHLYKRWKRSHYNIYKDKEARIAMQDMLVIDTGYVSVPPSVYIPHTASLIAPSSRTSSSTHSAGSGFGRYVFEDSDSCIPPPYEGRLLSSSPSPRKYGHSNYNP